MLLWTSSFTAAPVFCAVSPPRFGGRQNCIAGGAEVADASVGDAAAGGDVTVAGATACSLLVGAVGTVAGATSSWTAPDPSTIVESVRCSLSSTGAPVVTMTISAMRHRMRRSSPHSVVPPRRSGQRGTRTAHGRCRMPQGRCRRARCGLIGPCHRSPAKGKLVRAVRRRRLAPSRPNPGRCRIPPRSPSSRRGRSHSG